MKNQLTNIVTAIATLAILVLVMFIVMTATTEAQGSDRAGQSGLLNKQETSSR